MEHIDTLSLYSTIFANLRDEAQADTSSWSFVYNGFDRIANPADSTDDLSQKIKRVHDVLLRDEIDTYHAWVVAAFSPWALVPTRPIKSKVEKPPVAARAAEVARDNLRSDNKTVCILKESVGYFEEFKSLKDSFIAGEIPGTESEIRQRVGLSIRSWKKDWRMVAVMALLQEIMAGAQFSQGKVLFCALSIWSLIFDIVIDEHDKFLSYIEKENLLDVTELRPIVNGTELSAALGVRGGRWLSAALEVMIEWQLLHPETTEKEKALDEMKRRRAEFGV